MWKLVCGKCPILKTALYEYILLVLLIHAVNLYCHVSISIPLLLFYICRWRKIICIEAHWCTKHEKTERTKMFSRSTYQIILWEGVSRDQCASIQAAWACILYYWKWLYFRILTFPFNCIKMINPTYQSYFSSCNLNDRYYFMWLNYLWYCIIWKVVLHYVFLIFCQWM